MLWDESFESWTTLGITTQHTTILYAPDGTEIERWNGPIPEGEVLELAAQFT